MFLIQPLSLHCALSGDSHHRQDQQEVRSEGAVRFLLCVVESVDTLTILILFVT